MAAGSQENLTGWETDQQMLSMIQVVMGQLMGGGRNTTITVLEYPGSAMWMIVRKAYEDIWRDRTERNGREWES